MHFVVLDGVLLVSPYFGWTVEYDKSNMGAGMYTTSSAIKGEARLMGPEIPGFFNEDGIPRKMDVAVQDGEKILLFDELMVTSADTMSGYTSNEAMYVEWLAASYDFIEESETLL